MAASEHTFFSHYLKKGVAGYILAGGGYILADGGWWWIYFVWWWVVVDIFWLVVCGGIV